MTAKKWVAIPINEQAARRKCGMCLNPATRMKYRRQKFSNRMEVSTRRFACEKH